MQCSAVSRLCGNHNSTQRFLQEFGLNSSIGPINVAALGSATSGGDELAILLGQVEAGGSMGVLVEREVKVSTL